MSTDPTKPMQAPAPSPEDPEADASQAAPPTVQTPAFKTPPPPPPPPPPSPAGGPRAPERPQNPAQAAPPTQVQAPPPASPVPPTQWDQPPQPTFVDRTPPTQWDRPPERPQPQRPQPPQPQLQPPPPQQQWQPPQPQPKGWTEPQPWVEPQDDRPGHWPPPPAPQSQGPGQWAQPPADQPPVSQGPPEQQPRFQRRRRKRRVRRSVMALFTVIVILILLVIGDRVALAITENDMASQFQQNGLPVKPSVTIEGFPFLTQLAAKDFNKVDISASNVPVPLPTGGSLSITSIHATINGLHISSYSSTASAHVDQMNATAFVSFGALAAAGGIGGGTGITVAPVNSNTVKISANLGGIFSDSEEAQITTNGAQTITVKVLPSGGALGSVLSSFGSFSFNLPKGVPPTLKITNLTLNSQGLTISAAATDATFSQS
jgi:LmeA-like phospholipid-binding